MRALAQWVVRGPLSAVTVVVGFALAAFLVPPLMLLSGGALALVTLAFGPRKGGGVLGGATAVAAVLGLGLGANPWFGVGLSAVDWVPVWLCAASLWATRSLAVGMAVALVLALLALGAVHFAIPDPTAAWRQLLGPMLSELLQGLGVPEEELGQALDTLSSVATGVVVASAMSSTVLALLIGRAWQALLYNPGGFGLEFRGLRLGRTLGVLAAVTVGAASLWHQPLLFELALILLMAFAFEGVAVVHWLAYRSDRPLPWLVGFYTVLVLVFPQALPVVMGLGVVDGVFDLRTRIAGRSPTG